MEAFRRTDLLLPLVAGFMAWMLSWWAPAAPLDLLFGTILMTALLVVLRLLISATLQAQAGQRRALRLTAVHSEQVARQAVAAERRRLSRDIEQSVLTSMRVIAARAEAAASTADPRRLFRLIQADAACTNVELRRQLGLLQVPDLEPAPVVCATGGRGASPQTC